MDSYQTAQDIRDAITLIRCTIDHAAECDLQNQGEESLHCDMGTESSVMAEVANRLEDLLMVCELCGDERLQDPLWVEDIDLEIQRCEPCTERESAKG